MKASSPIQKVQRSRPAQAQFSILIPSWNNLPYLQLCIDSIRKNSVYEHQIIVHVNEGIDGTLDWVKDHPELDYSYCAENLGICYALNIARGLAQTEYILYLNDDMYVCPGWDQELLQAVRKIGHPFFFLSATAIEPVDSGNRCVIIRDWGQNLHSFQEKDLLEGFAQLSAADWQGATWPPNLVHRDLWDLCGGYSTEFSPGMYSDPDFSMKLWRLGVRHFQGLGASRVYHFGSKSTARISGNPGYFRFISKWGMAPSLLAQKFLRSGQPFDGPLAEQELTAAERWKSRFKRLQAAWRNPR
jgi:glycosyltransferase involved in cell wall biosynthesis